MGESSTLTLEQLEQHLSQRLILLYQTLLGHQLKQVSCKLADKTITIIAEDSITPPEQLLFQNNQKELVKQFRLNLLKALEPHLSCLIEELIDVPTVDIICDSVFDSGRTSIVALLSAAPDIVSS